MTDRLGCLLSRELADGKILDLQPLLLGRVQVTVSQDAESEAILEGW
jgi:hypothetical protein